jgi:hypothetical protein
MEPEVAENQRKMTPEMIMAVSALLVSLVTAVATIHSAYTSRAYARASLWPNLGAGVSFNDTGFRFLLMNRGTGPAMIQSMRVEYDGKPMHNWQQLLNQFDPKFRGSWGSSFVSRVTLPTNQMLDALTVSDKKLARQMYDASDKLKVEICYCSVYDECWITSDIEQQNQPVTQCPDRTEWNFAN